MFFKYVCNISSSAGNSITGARNLRALASRVGAGAGRPRGAAHRGPHGLFDEGCETSTNWWPKKGLGHA